MISCNYQIIDFLSYVPEINYKVVQFSLPNPYEYASFSRSGTNSRVHLEVKCAGARSTVNPHAACDVTGVGNGATE